MKKRKSETGWENLQKGQKTRTLGKKERKKERHNQRNKETINETNKETKMDRQK